ncbi:MAG: Chaperone protein HscA [Chlamydiales bacterium]|nr:Chaperone protein HscA [Chlamydiales bacterium]
MIIGIDLGTTHCTLAYCLDNQTHIEALEIHQRITEDMFSAKKMLPSFLFFPLEEAAPSIGWYAKQRGGELPHRLISSAKSWLCHDGINRREPFLPLSDCEFKKSPIEVCTALLQHLKHSWEEKFPELDFADQTVVVTVPASFDPSARQLVQEAIEAADFPQTRLIEEPLAAFYAWLDTYKEEWREHLKVGDTVLVVDSGGGTTDFSLISVEEKDGDLCLERKAVGNHLLLGGDNIDLALAHLAQSQLSQEMDEWQFQTLVQACREAKEQLLCEDAQQSVTLQIKGRGSSLIGGSLSTTLKKEEVETRLVDGFFPHTTLDTPLQIEPRSGISKLGLPYARDPRITVQLAHFLKQAAVLPTSVLFNGGTMKGAAFQQRMLAVLSDWKGAPITNLPGADLDFAVSRGAVYYGWTHQNKGIRVRAGTARSYYIGVESALPAVPGFEPPLKKIKIAPFGMEEGSEWVLENQEFSLVLDESAVFRFFSKTSETQAEYSELHPIETLLKSQGASAKSVLVKLKAKVTELGVLELWCVAEDGRKWKLEFDTRQEELLVR